MAQPFLGQIMQVGFGFAPIDWAQAAGQTLAISQNAALFSLLGTTFGGNGTSTFQLPNVQGRVIVGVGQTPGLSTYVWGEIGGAEQVTLNLSQMPTHTHAAAVTQPTATLSALSESPPVRRFRRIFPPPTPGCRTQSTPRRQLGIRRSTRQPERRERRSISAACRSATSA